MTVNIVAPFVPSDHRDHVLISFEELRELLGMEGVILNVWREDDSDYLHVTTMGTGKNSILCLRGSYCEARSYGRNRK